MSVHPLVVQLRFARSELLKVLEGLPAEDAQRRMLPMNSISWMVGHLANHEASFWLLIAQGDSTYRWLHGMVASGKPASTPPLVDMLAAWREITAKADAYLDTISAESAVSSLDWKGQPYRENVGTMLLHLIYHYFYHIGEAHAARQMMGHTGLPDFISDMDDFAWGEER
ncbi:MAG TPA: DinB family protein [Anaerolineaceae bacterium]